MSASAVGFVDYLKVARPAIEAELERLLPPAERPPRRLHAAMRYSVFAGGKRFRPALVGLVAELFGAPTGYAVTGGAALELIHTYSLIHDDLPALDDDELRRGRPTLHRAFDEATAILAGDALLTLGLTVLAAEPAELSAASRARAVALVGDAIGTGGMIGGQAEDLAAEAAWPSDPEAALERIHLGKTAALISACCRLGGLYAGVPEPTEQALGRLGVRLGLLFQIRDDLLDVESSTAELGKTAGKDARATKLTYPALVGVDATRARLAAEAAAARREIAAIAADARVLDSLVEFLHSRTS